MRVEHLIYLIRESTDHDGENSGVTDNEITGYIEDAQKTIQALVFKSNTKADLFRGSHEYDFSYSREYELPEDVYAVNAIYGVQVYTGSEWVKINRIEVDAPGVGYWTEDGKLKIKGYDNQRVKVLYFKKLPKPSKRVGKVASKTSSSVTLEAGFDTSIGKMSDYVKVISKTGEEKAVIFIDSMTGAVITTSDDTTNIATSDFVLNGKDSENEIKLNEECLPYLKDYVRQRIYGRQNYNDGGKQDYFTSAQKAEIVALFANNQKDDVAPPQYDIDLDLEL